ncbi:hypothetical protein [Vibrio furnissii]|uniref:hypothetical protein n=1 Tax=Vibrio furnissii TaxID=29494 RepID=UPI001EEA4319|nr:hypothetical protein [Vibrio furnissii]MCG6216232.1 hypothetical protein [Vibrio furnissii]
MADSQNKIQDVDIYREIVDLDELLRFLAGAITDDVAMRGLGVALVKAKELSGKVRDGLGY